MLCSCYVEANLDAGYRILFCCYFSFMYRVHIDILVPTALLSSVDVLVLVDALLNAAIISGVQSGGLEADRPVGLTVRPALHVRETHVDHQGQGALLEAPVCGLRLGKAAAYRQLHQRQLQPPGPAVSRRGRRHPNE